MVLRDGLKQVDTNKTEALAIADVGPTSSPAVLSSNNDANALA
jgi:hypothetical protein